MAIKQGWTDLGNGLVQGPADYYGGTVDINNPIYQNYQEPTQQIDNGPVANGGAGAAPNQNGSGEQVANPYAPPTQNTTNAGSQVSYRDALIQQMNQNPVPSRNDEAVRAQVDPYRAAIDRQVRGQIRDEAESNFGAGQDFGTPERLAAAERGGQASGLFESQVVGREIQARRQQIQQALGMFGESLSDDQRRALQKQLADLDAQLRREGLSTQSGLGMADIGLRRELGTGSLSNQLLGLLLNNQQFGDRLGLDAALAQAGLNRDALLSLF